MLLQGGSFLTLMSNVAAFPPLASIFPLWMNFPPLACISHFPLFFCSVLLEASPPTALECNRGGESHCCRFWAACQFSFACQFSYLIFNYHVLVSILPHFSILLCLSVFSLAFELRYESSTLILYKELSSSIFQSLWVSQSGIGNTSPELHFVWYIKA